MRAELGGMEASPEVRAEAWKRLAHAYMERSDAQTRRDEARARLDEELKQADSERFRQVVDAYRFESSRSESS